MALVFQCESTRRRQAVLAHVAGPGESPLNGIDYLEVFDHDLDSHPDLAGFAPQTLLRLHLLKPVDPALAAGHVRVDGGERIIGVRVVAVRAGPALAGGADNQLWVEVDRAGDFSEYTLRLVAGPGSDHPAPGIDRVLGSVAFRFKVDCPTDFDCAAPSPTPGTPEVGPEIDYRARDWPALRRLMLDRMSAQLPGWSERNPADLGVTLVEIVAYAADQLSYYQDAVATEAYLGTARRRPSIRRHARLLDYRMHEGSNARTWVVLSVAMSAHGKELPPRTRFLTKLDGFDPVVQGDRIRQALLQPVEVFEALHPVRLSHHRNVIAVHTWGETRCVLPAGAVRAYLQVHEAAELSRGDVLVFEEVIGPAPEGSLPGSGAAADARPDRRHAVRLVEDPVVVADPLAPDVRVVEVRWHDEDALPFDLCVREVTEGGASRSTAVVRGNVVLVDNGLSVTETVVLPTTTTRLRPVLSRRGLTHAVPYDHGDARGERGARATSATEAVVADPRRAVPDITLDLLGETWTPLGDLLATAEHAAHFVVEMEGDGAAVIRFGDDVNGRRPTGGRAVARYRVGNGARGNIGRGAIGHVAPPRGDDELDEAEFFEWFVLDGEHAVTNPLPAVGGTDPESLDQVRLEAPTAFRTPERAVRAEDYAAMAERHPDVQRAVGSLRWTGSWYAVFVTVDRKGGRPVDAEFQAELRAFLERFRMAGHDLSVRPPAMISLDLAFRVVVEPNQIRSAVHQALLATLGRGLAPDGRRAFFHPDNLTFGQPVYLSQVVAEAMRVPGVQWVDFSAERALFRRLGDPASDGLSAGVLEFGDLEIPRLDNDPNRPENGRLVLSVEGGL